MGIASLLLIVKLVSVSCQNAPTQEVVLARIIQALDSPTNSIRYMSKQTLSAIMASHSKLGSFAAKMLFQQLARQDKNPLRSMLQERDLFISSLIIGSNSECINSIQSYLLSLRGQSLRKAILWMAKMNLLTDGFYLACLLSHPFSNLIDDLEDVATFRPSKLTFYLTCIKILAASNHVAKLSYIGDLNCHPKYVKENVRALAKMGLYFLNLPHDPNDDISENEIYVSQILNVIALEGPLAADVYRDLLNDNKQNPTVHSAAIWGACAICGRYGRPVKDMDSVLPSIPKYLDSDNFDQKKGAIQALYVSRTCDGKYKISVEKFFKSINNEDAKFTASIILLRIEPDNPKSLEYIKSIVDPAAKTDSLSKWAKLESQDAKSEGVVPLLIERLQYAEEDEALRIIRIFSDLRSKATRSLTILKKLRDKGSDKESAAAIEAIKQIESN